MFAAIAARLEYNAGYQRMMRHRLPWMFCLGQYHGRVVQYVRRCTLEARAAAVPAEGPWSDEQKRLLQLAAWRQGLSAAQEAAIEGLCVHTSGLTRRTVLSDRGFVQQLVLMLGGSYVDA